MFPGVESDVVATVSAEDSDCRHTVILRRHRLILLLIVGLAVVVVVGELVWLSRISEGEERRRRKGDE